MGREDERYLLSQDSPEEHILQLIPCRWQLHLQGIDSSHLTACDWHISGISMPLLASATTLSLPLW